MEETITEANRLRQKVESDGKIARDEFVIEAIAYPDRLMTRESYYHRFVAPLAETADTLHWNHAWRFDPDEYPADAETRKERLSGLQIPDDSLHKLVPKAVRDCCRALKTAHETAGRGASMYELGLAYQLNHSDIAFQPDDELVRRTRPYLKRVPWIESPQRNAPAWEHVDQTAETTANTATGESHG